ncbi:MAG: hypothetical protein L6Q71_05530, partial [Planctomycetes bacterium]|nr:hypothetical protein [Planctomycetota bacterium]
MKSAKYLAGAFGSAAFVLALGISQSLNIQSSGLQAQEASGGDAGTLASGGGSSGSKTEKTVDPQLFRSVSDDGADAPTGRGFLRMPASEPVASSAPEPETGEPPAEPSEPETESGGAHQSFDAPVAGKCVFVIDVSLSMSITDVG